MWFKEQLIADAETIINSIKPNVKSIQLNLPSCKGFGDYHGWLLSTSTDSFTLRLKQMNTEIELTKSWKKKKIAFTLIDTNDEE
jgi:hypothetical protein